MTSTTPLPDVLPHDAPDGGTLDPEHRLHRWERAVEWPLVGVAALFLVAYAVPVVLPDAPEGLRRACGWMMWATWAAFVVDYAARLTLTTRRWHFVWTHPLDLAVLALPVLRPLRLVLVVSALLRLKRAGSRHLRGEVVTFAAAGTALLVLTGALAITQAERGVPGSSVQNLGDGFWWAIVTMSTVGYGDMYPVTVVGRFVAVGMMLGGIALLGVVTATLASWLVEQVDATSEAEHHATRGQVDEMRAEMREELRALRAELGARPVEQRSGTEH